MLNLNDLSQFVAFYRYGTLTKVAEIYFTSQPTLTRTMKRVEQEFGVTLFVRGANRIELNETGKKAAKLAEKLLDSANDCVRQVQDFDRNLHTVTVESCAPAPLWSFIPEITEKYPGMTISSKLSEELEEIERRLESGLCDVAILPYQIEKAGFTCKKYVEEHLSICVPQSHELAKYSELTTEAINGYNCLLASEIGFWNDFCKRKLPASKFLVQTDEFAFNELVRESTLPCFTTDLASSRYGSELSGRIVIPITDKEANVTYYIVTSSSKPPTDR
ncbi:MAG: LysR family transcriptional regulator [Oscillospiraceae bacterium]|nr:LysR family transcriptional regulator [Oscillospiraceae bacterium]